MQNEIEDRTMGRAAEYRLLFESRKADALAMGYTDSGALASLSDRLSRLTRDLETLDRAVRILRRIPSGHFNISYSTTRWGRYKGPRSRLFEALVSLNEIRNFIRDKPMVVRKTVTRLEKDMGIA